VQLFWQQFELILLIKQECSQIYSLKISWIIFLQKKKVYFRENDRVGLMKKLNILYYFFNIFI